MRKCILTGILFFSGLGLKAQTYCDSLHHTKGIASFYHDKFVGKRTATGDVFNNRNFTAASNKLKLGTYVKVTNVDNGKTIVVRINDRMARSNPRLIDLTSLAAEALGFKTKGIQKVKIEVIPSHEGRSRILAQREQHNLPPAKLF